MKTINRYQVSISKSANDIFSKLLKTSSLQNTYIAQTEDDDLRISINLMGSINGKLVISFAKETLNMISKVFSTDNSFSNNDLYDLAGEICNQIVGNFVTNIYVNKNFVNISTPEFSNHFITTDTSYRNLPLSFTSDLGGIDINFYYKEIRSL